jgi:hypothetical protein
MLLLQDLFLSNKLLTTTERSPSLAATSEMIPNILCNPTFHYHVHTACLLTLSTLGDLNFKIPPAGSF